MPVASSEDQVLISRASVDAVVRNLKRVGFRLVERSAYIDHTLTGLKVASFLLAEGVPFVPEDWQREPEDEIVDAFESLEFQDEAEQHELREGEHCGKDTCKGRSKGRPRDMASRSRSGDRRGQRQGGTCGSSLCPSHKGKNKGRSKGKDAPLSKTPCYYKSRYEDEGCKRWASFRVHMKGKSSTPKVRAVCGTCRDWLFEPSDGADPLADYHGIV